SSGVTRIGWENAWTCAKVRTSASVARVSPSRWELASAVAICSIERLCTERGMGRSWHRLETNVRSVMHLTHDSTTLFDGTGAGRPAPVPPASTVPVRTRHGGARTLEEVT